MADKESILKNLKNVEDPEMGLNIVDLGLIYEIELKDGKVHIRMTMTSPMCPATYTIMQNTKFFAEQVEGVGEAEVELVWDPPWAPDKMTEEGKAQLDMMGI